MRHIPYRLKKITAFCLIGAMILSTSGCKSKEPEKVVNYGGEEAAKAAAEMASEGDSLEKTTKKMLRDIYGEKVKWNENVSVNFATRTDRNEPVELKIGVSFPIPDIEGMNVYELSESADFTDELSYANGFFDDGATKLEKIGYENATKYMSMLHEYRGILREIKSTTPEANLFISVNEMVDVIDSTYPRTYFWADEDTYYIHMYEGTFQGIKYGLILAYSEVLDQRYIFFDPIDIKDYYPDHDFQTLMFEQAQHLAGDEIENECGTDRETVKEIARKFLAEKVHLPEAENIITTDYVPYMMSSVTANCLSTMLGVALNRNSLTALSFSDSDYVSTYDATEIGGGYRGCEILGEQRDQIREYIYNHSGTNNYDAVFNVIGSPDSKADIYRDGYALYIGSPLEINDIKNNFDYGIYLNTGMVKITSKGFYGADLKLGRSILDVTEKVELLDFEKIKESFLAEMEKNFDPKKIGTCKIITLESMYLTYFEIMDEKSGRKKMVPVWEFNMSVQGKTYQQTGVCGMTINAMDGSLVNYYQYSNKELNEIDSQAEYFEED